MTVAELIASREPDWRELEELSRELRKPSFRQRSTPETVARFTSLYRAVSSDLALAESYQLPPSTVARLNELVAVAHNTLYRQKGGRSVSFRDVVLFEAPRWILTDVMFWAAFVLFWGSFLLSGFLARYDDGFAKDVVGSAELKSVERMYDEDFAPDFLDRVPMAAFYISHNGGIGLKSFAFGILGVFPGLFILLSNAVQLGAVFGHMAGPMCSPDTARRFAEFTTAHGPFELTAIVLSAAAGMRMGAGLIMTRGYTRIESLRRATIKASPAIFVGFVLFCLAALLEAFVSPNPMTWLDGSFITPYLVKRVVFALSTIVLLVYFVGLGGVSIARRYRGLPFGTAFRAFWRSAADVETNRVEIEERTTSPLEPQDETTR